RELYNSIVTEIVHSIVQMAVQWTMQHVIMAGVSAAFRALDVGGHIAATQTKVAVHGAGEGQMTLFTMIGTAARMGWHLAETVFHGIMVAIRLAAHIAGEIMATIITGAQAAIRAMYHAVVAAI